jgi:hypothetical protein
MAKIKGLGNSLSDDERDDILEGFQDTLLDFCHQVLPNGYQRDDEWICADLENSPLEGGKGSCAVNLRWGCFNDTNPSANPQTGGAHRMFCTLFGLRGAAGWRAMRMWNAKRILPDGRVGGTSSRPVKMGENHVIVPQDKFEEEQVGWIRTFQSWTAWAEKHGVPYADMPPGYKTYFASWTDNAGNLIEARNIDRDGYVAKEKAANDKLILEAVSKIYSRRWQTAVEFSQSIRDDFAAELAEYRGLSPDVFRWLIDAGEIARVYSRKELKEGNSLAALLSRDPLDLAKIVVKESWDIAFPVWRETPDGILFLGMHIPWQSDKTKGWKYDPKGCSCEPWVVGDVPTADLIIIAESTWDIIAYMDLRKVFTWTKTTWATVNTRGASNGNKIPTNMKEGAVVVRLLQNDAANAAWVAHLPPMPPGIIHRQIQPPEGTKDLNDWIKEAGADNVLKAIW